MHSIVISFFLSLTSVLCYAATDERVLPEPRDAVANVSAKPQDTPKVDLKQAPPKGQGQRERGNAAKGEKGGERAKRDPLTSSIAGLGARNIGPSVTSGRIVGLSVHPTNPNEYFVAVASGGVWKTTNAGSNWTPVFDNEASYSIGYVLIDPKSPNIVWVGTGENNSQRSVSYGDGVYRSEDGGRSWKNVGLQKSEHIGKIIIDPRDSNTVYVAAQGPLWGPGGDRGLYKTTDGGKTWNQILAISDNTGVTDVVLDPRNPDVLIAASYQRRRHVWTIVNGGPESALHRSIDGGKTWTKIRGGLPMEEIGRAGLAVAPSKPNVVYAIIEANERKGGIFRSNDFGITWEKRNDSADQSQYYAHLTVDPKDADRIYVMNVLIQVSDDGGRNLRPLGERNKHVDNHYIWIDPNDTNHYRVGCDGGLYESFDAAANWNFIGNLPITQFYDIACDQTMPFYNVYGGTQDNNTLGGPARTRSAHGATNADWFVLLGGDGFQCRVDPKDPNIVYAELQYGVLTRYDRRTGESVGIQPHEGKGEPPLRFNWDSALLISPHSNTRIYFAANKLFRSEDRGNTWKAVSGDLTRQIDRDTLPVMGKIQSVDAVSKHVSTSFYGNIVALTESPKKEGLLYVGTDDGLIQISENGGGNWTKVEKFPGVPDRTYVSRLLGSLHDANTVYASFDNHKNSDFAPYFMKSTDAGKTWVSIAGDLPANGSVLAIAEDHVNPNLLFVGTEFGLFVTLDGGKKWNRMKSGMPTIAVRDLAIHRGMNDLVVGTFGRGFYIIDDYSPLRKLDKTLFDKACEILPVRTGWSYIPTRQFGGRGKGSLGESLYTAPNPPFGATITYYLKDSLQTKKQKRREAERKPGADKKPAPYPTREQIRAEEEEEAPAIVLTISDPSGKPIRNLSGPVSQGLHRVTWDLRVSSGSPPRGGGGGGGGGRRGGGGGGGEGAPEDRGGALATPGIYKVAISKRVQGVLTPLAGPVDIPVVALEGTGSAAERKELAAFMEQATKLSIAVAGVSEKAGEVSTRIEQIKSVLDHTPTAQDAWKTKIRDLEKRSREVLRALRGDSLLAGRNENVPTSIAARAGSAISPTGLSTSGPTTTQREAYRIASEELGAELKKLDAISKELKELEDAMDAAGLPYTPGRNPKWPKGD